MRIAFSGSHRVGKSTLVARIAEAMSGHESVAEPYALLEEEGYEHGDPPSIDDFEAQLARSIDALGEAEEDALFDRCPADVLAYLLVHDDADAFDWDAWRPRIRRAMKTLDLVVFVPIEEHDRIELSLGEDAEWRLAVHEKLHEILVDNLYGIARRVLVVEGAVEARARRVMKRVTRKRDTFER